MRLSDFMIMQKGYWERRKRDELNFANVAFIIDAFATGISGKRADYKKFIKGWFGEVDKPMTAEEHQKRSEEMMKRVELTNKILAEKESLKNGRRIENSN
jgi:hypothetical protein